MQVILIAAIGKQRQLGLNGDLPWRVPGDLAQFKRLTTGHAILMGRKTFCGEGLGKPLPNRRNIVLSSSLSALKGVDVVRSFDEGLTLAKAQGEKKLFICGGTTLYEKGLSLADELLLSEIDYDGKADTYFPVFNVNEWVEKSRVFHKSENAFPSWSFVTYGRVTKSAQ